MENWTRALGRFRDGLRSPKALSLKVIVSVVPLVALPLVPDPPVFSLLDWHIHLGVKLEAWAVVGPEGWAWAVALAEETRFPIDSVDEFLDSRSSSSPSRFVISFVR